jgi:hypothetical protein
MFMFILQTLHCTLQSYDYAAAAAAAAAVRYEEEPFHMAAVFKRGAFTLRYSGSGRSSAPDVSGFQYKI